MGIFEEFSVELFSSFGGSSPSTSSFSRNTVWMREVGSDDCLGRQRCLGVRLEFGDEDEDGSVVIWHSVSRESASWDVSSAVMVAMVIILLYYYYISLCCGINVVTFAHSYFFASVWVCVNPVDGKLLSFRVIVKMI